MVPVLLAVAFAAAHAARADRADPDDQDEDRGTDEAVRLLGVAAVLHALASLGWSRLAWGLVVPPVALVGAGLALQVWLTPGA